MIGTKMFMNIGDSIKIKKIDKSAFPRFKTAEWKDFVPGINNGLAISVPVEYEIKGKLLSDIQVGLRLTVFRTERNGIEVSGIFQTSAIQKIEEISDRAEFSCYRLFTENSIYEAELIGPNR